MKKALTLTIIFAILASPLFVVAQAPTPPVVPTLGLVSICSAGDSFTNATIYSPNNQSYQNNPLQLNFSVTAVGLFAQFGNVGYSVDGGTIYSVNDFVRKIITKTHMEWYDRTTVFARVVLPQLSDGNHSVTVYYGWQYLGTNARFEVFAYETTEFIVGKPIIDPPKILVVSPNDSQEIDSDSITLVLKISAPLTVNAIKSQLSYVYYEADWLSEKQYVIIPTIANNGSSVPLQLNSTLSNIPNGNHKVLIVVGGNVTVKEASSIGTYFSESNSTIILDINSPIPSRNQTLIILAALLIPVIIALTAILIKRKKNKHST